MFVELIKGIFGVLPSQCLVCRAWPSESLCEACVSRFAQPKMRCARCALPVPSGVICCGACLKNPPPLDACLAAVAYDFPWSDLIVDYKFKHWVGRAGAFGLLLHSTPWVDPALDAADWVLPMPLSAQRLKTRGFNQALVLAQHIAPHKINTHLLLRIKDTPPQSTLNRQERLSSVKDAFAVNPLLVAQIKGTRLVLVDDVMTSGASLFSAAKVLRAAGAAHITGLVLARTE
jgi:ComF family protein